MGKEIKQSETITEKWANYNTAFLAAGAGFDQECDVISNDKDKQVSNVISWKNSQLEAHWVTIPRLSLLQKWMREKLNIICESRYNSDYNYYEAYVFVMNTRFEKLWMPTTPVYTYECILEAAIQEGLGIYITENESCR